MKHQLELRHFTYFLAVAEELHFRKAAERLFISQPGLSRQIRQMEEILKAELFIRNKRNVALTAAGKFLYHEIKFIFNHIEFVEKQVGLIEKGLDGEIRLGFLGSAMQAVIPNLLMEINQRYPKIRSSLEEMSNYDQLKAIQQDNLDLGFVRLEHLPNGLLMKPVYKDSFSLVLPASHWLTQENFTGVDQVSEENFILFSVDYSSTYYYKIVSICEDKGFRPKVSHKSVHAQTIFKLVEIGLGVAIVPTALQHGYNLGVKFIEIRNIRQEAVLSVVWKADNRNPVLHQVIDLIEAVSQ
ncbi:MAG: LysR family transcriptional regulator [Flammeovirgaceae bacterium]